MRRRRHKIKLFYRSDTFAAYSSEFGFGNETCFLPVVNSERGDNAAHFQTVMFKDRKKTSRKKKEEVGIVEKFSVCRTVGNKKTKDVPTVCCSSGRENHVNGRSLVFANVSKIREIFSFWS